MSFFEILLSGDFIRAALAYSVAALISLIGFAYVHNLLEDEWLQWPWDHFMMPLLRACLVLMFIAIAYPSIFGLVDAPPLAEVLARDDMRIHHLLNLVFVITLFFPLIPVVGDWHEFVLPLQGIAASMLLFNWLAREMHVMDVHYWPGIDSVLYMSMLASFTHVAAVWISDRAGALLDRRFELDGSGKLVSSVLVMIMQGPIIVLYCRGLGRQLVG